MTSRTSRTWPCSTGLRADARPSGCNPTLDPRAATHRPPWRTAGPQRETARVRNSTLHGILEAFTADAAGRLQAETAGGAEVPFEVTEERGGRARLYCYRPLTDAFIDDRLLMLRALPTYAPAARALADLESVGAYLQQRGEPRIPAEPRERADIALKLFLA